MLEVTAQKLGILYTDVPQPLLHLYVASGKGGHLRLDIFIVWIDAPAALLCTVPASISGISTWTARDAASSAVVINSNQVAVREALHL